MFLIIIISSLWEILYKINKHLFNEPFPGIIRWNIIFAFSPLLICLSSLSLRFVDTKHIQKKRVLTDWNSIDRIIHRIMTTFYIAKLRITRYISLSQKKGMMIKGMIIKLARIISSIMTALYIDMKWFQKAYLPKCNSWDDKRWVVSSEKFIE